MLVIDVQNAMFAKTNPKYEGESLLKNLQDVMNKTHPDNMPVFFIQHNDEEFISGTPLWEIHSLIVPHEGDIVIQKHTSDSFHKTELLEKLVSKQSQNLIFVGNQNEYYTDATILHAFSLGDHVTLIKDVHRTWNSNILAAQ
ncbi:isochorismatase family protein [Lederbergia galactosidilytica]|uniref:isochorismatase family protein n=1 Tax=Lederbergia galactosidilytica TaxID=217031 RepID=UPI0009EE6C3D|nr:isochorismatase family protein [Lederbergia galactosidilytica]